jgi:hypothetical protein
VTRRWSVLFALLCIAASGGCGEDVASTGDADPAPWAEVEPGRPATAPSQLREVGTDASELVQGRTGPGGRPFEVALRSVENRFSHSRRIGNRTFELGLRVRRPELSQYPCSSCHLHEGVVLSEERAEDVHRDIQPVHPEETGATCGTCHADFDVEQLLLRSGETTSFDHAYRLCAQCHFQQVDAWAGGAHGKRLDGWQGPRVVMGCADCHDPHQPALEKRIPFPGPTLPRSGRSGP